MQFPTRNFTKVSSKNPGILGILVFTHKSHCFDEHVTSWQRHPQYHKQDASPNYEAISFGAVMDLIASISIGKPIESEGFFTKFSNICDVCQSIEKLTLGKLHHLVCCLDGRYLALRHRWRVCHPIRILSLVNLHRPLLCLNG